MFIIFVVVQKETELNKNKVDNIHSSEALLPFVA